VLLFSPQNTLEIKIKAREKPSWILPKVTETTRVSPYARKEKQLQVRRAAG
jgi:hypothetical protein